MEKAGFDPKDMFTDEQIEKMRGMTANGFVMDRPEKRRYGAIAYNKVSNSGSE